MMTGGGAAIAGCAAGVCAAAPLCAYAGSCASAMVSRNSAPRWASPPYEKAGGGGAKRPRWIASLATAAPIAAADDSLADTSPNNALGIATAAAALAADVRAKSRRLTFLLMLSSKTIATVPETGADERSSRRLRNTHVDNEFAGLSLHIHRVSR